MTMTSINPFTKKIIEKHPLLNSQELNCELEKCKDAYKLWKESTYTTREKLAKNLEVLLNTQKESLATLISNEMGKPFYESLSEIEKCIQLVSYYRSEFQNLLSAKQIDEHTEISYQPTGAIFGIMPWNFPFWQVFRYVIPNLLAGNICLLKHAPNVMGCGRAMETLFLQAGFPQHTFKNLTISVDQTETVIKNAIVTGVCVTGSTKAGSAIASLAGKHLKPSVLELGGIDASVILPDADFNKALSATFDARMLNAGQICIAPKRIYIPIDKLEAAISFCKKNIANIKQGNPLDTNTTMGPIAKAEFIATLEQQIRKAIEQGAELITGGNGNPPFFTPTLLVIKDPNLLLEDEIFGPVLCLIPYTNTDNIATYTNNSKYGLGTAIWSKNIKKAKQLANAINVGYVCINKIVTSDPRYPFGGTKNSGYGKELGEAGFKTFLNAKTISI